MAEPNRSESRLGEYLRDRRARMDPAAFGFPAARRRTAGLRREEVASRANISPTWYTWLEQGRGGAPSADVLDRIANAMMLTDAEREHLFLLALGRPPEAHYRKDDVVTPRLQRVLDALNPVPALIRTAIWDVVAWNRGVSVVMTDYAALPLEQRNMLRSVFLDPRMRGVHNDWESVARLVIGAFRVDTARAGAGAAIEPLVSDLSAKSPDFARMWREIDIPAPHDGLKNIRHPVLGQFEFEFSQFAVDGRPDLGMLVYNPKNERDMARISTLVGDASGVRPPSP